MIIYLGEEPKNWLASEILRFSILTRTDANVEFIDLNTLHVELPREHRMQVPFFRWFIPFLQNFQGRVLYLDSNALVLGDIKKLFELDMQGKGVLAKKIENSQENGYYTNVMLMDCEKLAHWNLQEWAKRCSEEPNLMGKIMLGLPGAPNHDDFGSLPEEWASFDKVAEGTQLVSFANSTTYPWRGRGHKLQELYLGELKKAVESEEIPLNAILIEIQTRHIYNEILADMQGKL